MFDLTPSCHQRRIRAITLLESMIILAIIAFFVVLAMPTGRPNAIHRAKIEATHLFIDELLTKHALKTYQTEMGELPSSAEGLNALLIAPAGKSDKWLGPYLELSPPNQMTLDPWGHAYVYRNPGTHNKDGYDLFSPGPDGIAGTADDIGNW